MTELYKLLNVPRTASIAEIKAAYRLLAKELHPDVNNGSVGKTAKFRDVASAYEILSNIESRIKYDRSIGAPEVRSTSNRRYTPPRQPYEHTSYSNRASAQAAAENHRRAAGASHASMRFNVDEWNAWHYGDKAVTEALKRRNIYMGVSNDNNSKASKKAYKEAEERYKEAYRTAAAEAAAGQEQERLAKEKLARSREARRRVVKEEKEQGGLCTIS